MSSMSQSEYDIANNSSQTILDEDDEKCFCEKKQCMIGLASVAIGIGGFMLASLL